MLRRSNSFCYFFFALFMAASAASGQSRDSFIYSVKVVCTQGQSNLPFTVRNGGVTEVAETFVNLHNFSPGDVRFTYRAVQPRTGASPGAVYTPVTESIAGFAARSFDCGDFITLQQRPSTPAGVNPATEGFIVIETSVKIQVAAVYRSRSLAAALVDNASSELFWAGAKNVFGEGDLPHVEKLELNRMTEEEIRAGKPEGGGLDVPIIPMDRDGKIRAAGLGLGLGVGSSRGTGVGVGSGTSIDVEYIEPMVVRGRGRR